MAHSKSDYAAYIPKNENGQRKGPNFTSMPADSIPPTNENGNYSRIPKDPPQQGSFLKSKSEADSKYGMTTQQYMEIPGSDPTPKKYEKSWCVLTMKNQLQFHSRGNFNWRSTKEFHQLRQ